MQRATKEILKNDCFDLLRDAVRRPIRRRGGLPGRGGGRRRGHGRAGPRCRGPAAAVRMRRRRSTRPPPSASTPLWTPPSRSTCLGPSRVAAAIVAARDWPMPTGTAGPGALHPGVDCLRGRNPPGRGPRGAARRQPVQRGRGLADRGRGGPPPARRHRCRVPPARASGPVRQGRPRGAGWCRPPPPGRTGRTAARGLGQEADGGGGPGPGPVPRMARRLSLHEGPGRAGPRHPVRRRRAHDHRPPVHHRVIAGRAPPGLDPGIPDGRADHRLLRPRPAP